MNINGYETISSFYSDFTKAEKIDETAISNVYKDVFNQYKNSYRYLTELSIVLRCKMQEHNGTESQHLAENYARLWLDVENYAMDTLKGAERNYYQRATDGDMKWANYYLRVCEGIENMKR